MLTRNAHFRKVCPDFGFASPVAVEFAAHIHLGEPGVVDVFFSRAFINFCRWGRECPRNGFSVPFRTGCVRGIHKSGGLFPMIQILLRLFFGHKKKGPSFSLVVIYRICFCQIPFLFGFLGISNKPASGLARKFYPRSFSWMVIPPIAFIVMYWSIFYRKALHFRQNMLEAEPCCILAWRF